MAKRKSTPARPEAGEDGMFEDAGRQKALEATLADITKRYGDGAIVRLGDATNLAVDTLPTGSLAVDIALGVGGVPRGRITEIYGPESSGKTTLCLHIIAEAQKRGGLCAFIDMEHALDPSYAARIGVDVDRLYISQPDTGEQALEICEALVRSGVMDVVVVDSVAALVPRAEIEGDMGDSHVGLQARLMSQALRKLSGSIKQSNVVCLFTNQLREKVGVMFGCFDANATVLLADGTRRAISQIVHRKEAVDVLTYNVETRQFEPKPVVNWFKNGQPVDDFALDDSAVGKLVQEYRTIIATYPSASGHTKFSCTPNHEILTPAGYIHAEDLDLGDAIVMRHRRVVLSDALWDLAYGSVMGDASIRKVAQHTAVLREAHAPAQAEYLTWKSDMFGGLSTGVRRSAHGDVRFSTRAETVFAEFKPLFYEDDDATKRVRAHHISALTPLSLAVWYQDAGARRGTHYAVQTRAIAPEEADAFVAAFQARFGLVPRLVRNGTWSRVVFSREQAERFEGIIAPYVHPSMAHKLRDGLTVGDCLPTLDFSTRREVAPFVGTVVETRRRLRVGGKAVRYNLQVADNANYIVGNTVVHNSPETTTGGRALKFYASVRLDIRRIQSIKTGGEVVGNRTRVRVTKNKVAPPFREAEFDIMFYENGISKAGEIVDLGIELNVVDKRGAFFRYNDEMIGQGRENAKVYLREHPEMSDKIEDAIRAHFGLPSLLATQEGAPARPPAPANGTPPMPRSVGRTPGRGAGDDDAPSGGNEE